MIKLNTIKHVYFRLLFNKIIVIMQLEAFTLIKPVWGKWDFVRQLKHLSRAKKRETQREIYLWKETPS